MCKILEYTIFTFLRYTELTVVEQVIWNVLDNFEDTSLTFMREVLLANPLVHSTESFILVSSS